MSRAKQSDAAIVPLSAANKEAQVSAESNEGRAATNGNLQSQSTCRTQGLDGRLADLLQRVHSGAYRAMPSRRVNIPKADGGTRPLGIAALEDKIIQKAVVEVILKPIYEAEFLGFSHGFRPGRSAHDAPDVLAYGIEKR